MGEECPGGRASRHTRFFDGPNSVGTPVAVEMPDPFGPRKRDQSGAAASSETASVTSAGTKHSASERENNERIAKV